MSSKNHIHFEISERKVLLRIIDIAVVIGTLYLVGSVFDLSYFKINDQRWLWSIVLAVYLFFFANVFELYDLQKASRIMISLRSVIYTASMTALIYLLTPFLTPELPENRLQILYFFLAILVSLLAWRAVYIKFFASSRFNKRIVIVADAADALSVVANLEEADPNVEIEGYINTDQTKFVVDQDGLTLLTRSDAQKMISNNQVSELIIASENVDGITPELYAWLMDLLERGFSVREYTQVYEEMTERVPVSYVGRDFYRYFPFARSNHNQLYRVYHRAFDIVVAILGLAIGLVLFPLILLGNLIGNRGSLLYTQERVGRNRKLFQIIKYRTMVKDAESDGAQFTKKRDVRITPFGKFLRKTRLDEFPQFWNILMGDMSVIGPRPERPIFVEVLTKKIPFYETRHIVKPGLTGWAQVKADYGESDEQHLKKLQYDLYYIKKRSIFLDIRILVKTLSTVVFFKGQ
ncbi:sugar transferase [Nonlabens ponticola]|uniref:Sugar transferase n=1 Tax=Nonlabens ponticola TaxID=2496866 RepID=A0A3S9MXL5_9FLAO|nr:sugar transferase [Nonlabens ponticola]AZQ43884.1 sugar transferase [Nonlabens ponticola]